MGSYYDVAGIAHGFLRNPQGIIISFEWPGSPLTSPAAIGSEGEITGAYRDAPGPPLYPNFMGFLREEDDTFALIDVPSAIGTVPLAITSKG